MGQLRYLTAGESHGEMLVGILDGMPSGMHLEAASDIDPALRARQTGYGRGHRQQIERDTAKIVSGVRFGVTTGAPIALLVQNRDWAHWSNQMSVAPGGDASKPVTIPRPGHSDLAGALKYAHESDTRNVFERSSARETAMRVAIGAIARTLLLNVGLETVSYVAGIGGISAEPISPSDAIGMRDVLDESPLRLLARGRELAMIAEIDAAKAVGDTLGGTVCCVVHHLPPGIGSHVQWDRKLDGMLAESLMSIQAVKAVEIGAGVQAANSLGSAMHDPIVASAEGVISRSQNHAGGLEGGMTNGEPLVVRVHMKPISTLMRPLPSISLVDRTPRAAHIERSDVCAVPALSVIVEHVVALTVASAMLETFGGDTIAELRSRVEARRKLLSASREVR